MLSHHSSCQRISGYIEPVCEHGPVRYCAPIKDPVRAHSDAIKQRAHSAHCDHDDRQQSATCGDGRATKCKKEPSKRRGVLDGLLIVFSAIIIFVLVAFAYWYGYEKGYWSGYWKGYGIGQNEPSAYEPVDGLLEQISEMGPCKRSVKGVCQEADDANAAIQLSRYYLKLGDAESALSNKDSALRLYRTALNIGSGIGAQASIYAAKRIQFQTMTCAYDTQSLARIARDYDQNPLGSLIQMSKKQAALKALGYYNETIDNRHGPASREAIRDFQGDLWFDQSGALTAEQTVLLVCAGAQIANNVSAQNVLGIMYAGGLGVRQNTDFALDWLEAAAKRKDADAAWNLALIYGTQTVLSSVKVCDAVQNAERADSYLREAAKAGHRPAKIAQGKYPRDTPEERWRKLAGDLNQPEVLNRVGRGCNPNN